MASSFSFGQWTINASEVFQESDLSFASVNLKPVVPGHVLIISKRVVPRFCDLTDQEVADIWQLAKKVGSKLESHYKATSTTMAIQDGPEAGQTVPHVHIHILPRCKGDFQKNDEVYDAIDDASKAALPLMNSNDGETQKLSKDLDRERKPRTRQEMSDEATQLRSLF